MVWYSMWCCPFTRSILHSIFILMTSEFHANIYNGNTRSLVWSDATTLRYKSAYTLLESYHYEYYPHGIPRSRFNFMYSLWRCRRCHKRLQSSSEQYISAYLYGIMCCIGGLAKCRGGPFTCNRKKSKLQKHINAIEYVLRFHSRKTWWQTSGGLSVGFTVRTVCDFTCISHIIREKRGRILLAFKIHFLFALNGGAQMIKLWY